MRKLLCVLVLLVPGLLAFKHFQLRIPNGDQIPHPCKPNYLWQGLGHLNKDGGGARNRFGEDFDRNGQKWDRCLCEADSDEDGKTNGEELGDPDCEWVPGATPKITEHYKLSHPGVCDPYDSAQCQSVNDWEFCGAAAEFKCDGFDAEGVMNFTVQIPRFQVPAEVTTYVCVVVDIPTDDDFHVIGSVPELDNMNVMHHITVALCSDEAVAALNGEFDEPAICGMGANTCSGSLPGWTVGRDGHCLPDNYGRPIGRDTRYTKAYLQFHYNNPEKRADYTDASAIRFFYEPRKRANDLSRLRMSSLAMSIPPKQLHYEEAIVCSAECSEEHLGQVRYITRMLPHMHYMGRGFILEHYRGDQKLPDIVNMDDYSYDSPEAFVFDPPIEYHPGDTLVARCIFNSMQKDRWTLFGESTDDEMCIAYIGMYPPPRFECVGVDANRSLCYSGEETALTEGLTGCNLTDYMLQQFPQVYNRVSSVCNPDGVTCNPGCKEAVAKEYENPCLQDMYLPVTKYLFVARRQKNKGIPLMHMMLSCEPYEVQKVQGADGDAEVSLCPVVTDAATPTSRGSVLMVLLLFIMSRSTARW